MPSIAIVSPAASVSELSLLLTHLPFPPLTYYPKSLFLDRPFIDEVGSCMAILIELYAPVMLFSICQWPNVYTFVFP